MRWRKISREIIRIVLEQPDNVENKGNNNFNYNKNIDGVAYKIFCIREENKFLIKSAIKK